MREWPTWLAHLILHIKWLFLFFLKNKMTELIKWTKLLMFWNENIFVVFAYLGKKCRNSNVGQHWIDFETLANENIDSHWFITMNDYALFPQWKMKMVPILLMRYSNNRDIKTETETKTETAERQHSFICYWSKNHMKTIQESCAWDECENTAERNHILMVCQSKYCLVGMLHPIVHSTEWKSPNNIKFWTSFRRNDMLMAFR